MARPGEHRRVVQMADMPELIEQATFGAASWNDVNSAIVSLFPGSFSALIGQTRGGRARFSSIVGMSEDDKVRYRDHYGAINPWMPYWGRLRPGDIMRSSVMCPRRWFDGSPFIEEWLRPIQRESAGIGLKLAEEDGADLFLSVHVDERFDTAREEEVHTFILRHRLCFKNALAVQRRLEDGLAHGMAAAALVWRVKGIACVIDTRSRVIEANPAAERTFRRGDPVRVIGGGVRFVDAALEKWYARTLSLLLSGDTAGGTEECFAHAGRILRVSLSKLPSYSPAEGWLHQPRHLALLQLEWLDRPGAARRAITSLAESLRLTPGEAALAEQLAAGATLREAADRMGLAYETVRERVKALFAKTNTRRQSELQHLLSKLAQDATTNDDRPDDPRAP